jgi:hypothetical protein
VPDYKDIQIIINSRDRLTCLQALIDWLLNSGYTNLNVLDNDSAYPPLLEYYENIRSEGVRVYKTGKNLLSKALWSWTEAWKVVTPPFIYTDPDVVPTEDCPEDLAAFLVDAAAYLGNPYKVGPALKIDDIPDHYSQAPKVRKWEGEHFWDEICKFQDVPIYRAAIDTTFALYTAPFRPFQISGVRVGEPYVFRHLPWYTDSQRPTEEEIFYEKRVQHGTHSWGLDRCYSGAVNRYFETGKM